MIECLSCHQFVEEPVHGFHVECFIQEFRLPDHTTSTDFSDVAIKSNAPASGHLHPMNSSFFHGKFKKYAAKLNDRSYILKVMDKNYPELPHVEYLCNQIAKALGVNTPDFHFIRFMNEVETFVVRNFMDHYVPGNLIHIYHFLDKEQPFSCENVMQIVKDKVGRIDAMKQFVSMCLFDALVGNHDRHGRNIAFIETPKGCVFAPSYDNPSYLGIEEDKFLPAQHNPRGKISTDNTSEPTMKDYVLEFKRMGYEAWVEEFQKRVQKVSIPQMIGGSFVSPKRQQALLSLITRRIEEMNDALAS